MSHHPDNLSNPAAISPPGWQNSYAPHDAPAGGGGPGRFCQAGPIRKGRVIHPRSPAARLHVHKQNAKKKAVVPVVVPATADGFLNAIKGFEGNIPYMYRDSNGLVTVGIGFLIEDPATQKITAEARSWPFYIRNTSTKATVPQIEADFNAVIKLPYDSKVGFKALMKSFKDHTKLELSSTRINELFDQKVSEFWSQLKTEFGPAFNHYPLPVKYALLDMIFNLGRGKDIKKKGKIVKSTGIHQFKKMRAALDRKDWAKAGDLSHRGGIGEKRNNTIKAWFHSATSPPVPQPQMIH